RMTKKGRITQSKIHRHAEHGYVHPSRRPHLRHPAMPNAFVANRHAEHGYVHPSRRPHLPQTVIPNALAANRHAEYGCRPTATLNMGASKPSC
ncbi:MAG: hypothetical protein II579_08410, partial [Treponema sp.]|nr:hypothetical protein [Treponema sp.]